MLQIEKKVKELSSNFKEVADIAKQLATDNAKLEYENSMLLILIEELANEFMCVGNDPANPEQFTGDEGFVYKANERLAEKVNKVLGLVK